MGSDEEETGRWPIETPHIVHISKGFWTLDSPVTVAQWRALGGRPIADLHAESLTDREAYTLMGVEMSHESMWRYIHSLGLSVHNLEEDDQPMTLVNWSDAYSFCQRLECAIGSTESVRLPTEAEWEYSCRAGASPIAKSFSDPSKPILGEDSAEHRRRVGPQRVKASAPNHWGLYDTIGNVWQWTNDWFDRYQPGPLVDPSGPSEGTDKVPRGGCWLGPSRTLRAANRGRDNPAVRTPYIGFRPVLVAGILAT